MIGLQEEKNLLKKLNNKQQKLNAIYNNSNIVFISWTKEGNILDLNQYAAELFGWEKDFLINKDFISTIIAEEDRDIWQSWKNGKMEKLPADFSSRAVKKDGELINCSWNNVVIKNEGSIDEIISIAKSLNNDLENEIEMLKLVKAINETDNWVVITDPDGIIEYVNTTVKEITGYSRNEVIGKNPSLFKSNKHGRKFYENLWDIIKSGESFNDVIINKKKDGNYFYSEQTITPIKNHNSEIINFISVGRDITQNEKLKRKIDYISNYDIFFSLPNRRLIRKKINDLIEINQNNKLAVLAIKIKKIKYLNDIYSNSKSGENLINYIIDLINKNLNSNDFIVNIDQKNCLAYLGGDNFALIIDNIDSTNDVYNIAKNILSLFTNTVHYKEENLMFNAQIGISIYPDDSDNGNNLLSNAEVALIDVKENDCSFFNQQMNKKIKEFSKMEAKLSKAVENDEFLLHYQPYFKGADYSLYAFEALLRWEDPKEGMIYPAKFIPILENSQLIKKVGIIVVKKVLKALKEFSSSIYKPVPISINLSAKQLEDKDHLLKMYNLINESGIDHSLINFEITESSAMDDVNYTLKVMNLMKKYGFSISIDDFGTGYSSFSYLQKFPIDYLKIDINFIRNMSLNQESRDIVESIINIAHILKLKTIAEGVEKESELKELNKMGNDYIQGYYFSRPLEKKKIKKYFK